MEKSLRRKGFEEVSGRGRAHDHRFYRFFYNGSPVPGVVTKVSTGTGYKSLGDSLLGEMAKQCKLSRDQFLALVDCSLQKENYEALLVEQDVISKEDSEEDTDS